MQEQNNTFSEAFTVVMDNERAIVCSFITEISLWFNEKVTTARYNGYSQKGFGLNITDLDHFVVTLNHLAKRTNTSHAIYKLSSTKALVVSLTDTNQIDIRQYVKSKKFTGFTRKGLRLSPDDAIKLASSINAYFKTKDDRPALYSDNPFLTDTVEQPKANIQRSVELPLFFKCASCGTTSRPEHADNLCEVCFERNSITYKSATVRYDAYSEPSSKTESSSSIVSREVDSIPSEELLIKTFEIHGRRCYVCQKPYNKRHKNLRIFFDDGNIQNTSANNMYPVCVDCLQTSILTN